MLNKIHNMDMKEGFISLQKQKIKVDCIVTSPPYFNFQRGYQRKGGRHYSQDYGEVTYLIEDMFEGASKVLKTDGLLFLNFGLSYTEGGVLRPFRIADRMSKFGFECVDIIIWHKSNPIPIRGRLTNAYEYIFVFSLANRWKYKMPKPYIHNVWKFPVVMQNQHDKEYNYLHGAMFPEELPKRCIEISTEKGEIVLDPFMGSGTTAMACKQMGRKFIGFEINPSYVETANQRISQMTVSEITQNPTDSVLSEIIIHA
jgi:DNA modification methylase